MTIYDELEAAKSYEDARAKYEAGKSKIYTPFVSLLAQLERLDLLREAIFEHGVVAVDTTSEQTGTLERFVAKHSAVTDVEHKVQARQLLQEIVDGGKGALFPPVTKVGSVRVQLTQMGFSQEEATALLLNRKTRSHRDTVEFNRAAGEQGAGCCY